MVGKFCYTDDGNKCKQQLKKKKKVCLLIKAKAHVTDWLNPYNLQLNVQRTSGMYMYLTKKASSTVDPQILILGRKLQAVKDLNYLGIV